MDEVKIKVTVDEKEAAAGFERVARDSKGRFRKLGDDLGKEAKSGGGGGGGFGAVFDGITGTISKGFKAGGEAGMPILAASVTAVSPLIGASLAGAVIGGVGAAGIVGGVVLAFKDRRVAEATKDVGNELLKSLKQAAQPMVTPVLESIGKIKDAIKTINFGKIFSNAAQDMGPLVDGISRFIEYVGDGMESLSDVAGPTLHAIGDGIASVGDAIQWGMESLSDNGEDAAEALTMLFDVVNVGIKMTFGLINALTELWDIWKTQTEIDDVITLLADVGSEEDSVAAAATRAADAAIKHAEGMDTEKKSLKELSDELKAQTDPLFALIKAQNDVTEAQGKYNKALRDHGPRSKAAKDALDELGQASIGLVGKASAAANGFNGKLTPAMRQALHSANMTKPQIDALEASLQRAAASARNWEGTFTQTYITKFEQYGLKGPSPMGGYAGFASGGISGAASGRNAGGLTWVGEQGPELVSLPTGSTVHSNGDSRRMASGNGGGEESGGWMEARWVGSDSAVVNEIMKGIQLRTRRSFGGSVQAAMGT